MHDPFKMLGFGEPEKGFERVDLGPEVAPTPRPNDPISILTGGAAFNNTVDKDQKAAEDVVETFLHGIGFDETMPSIGCIMQNRT